MIRISLIYPRQLFSKVKVSLKLLQITPPTTKKEIKAKYLELAKTLHPDIKEQEGKAKSSTKIKEDSQLFIEVTKAYKHLNQLSEQQINNPEKQYEEKPEAQTGSNVNSDRSTTESDQERQRRATYSFFNRKSSQKQGEKQNEVPLYKQMPQLFVGLVLMLVFVGECSYLAYKRSIQNAKRVDPKDFSKTFENLNFKQKFNKNELSQQQA